LTSAWGDSWGLAWGDSWGSIGIVAETSRRAGGGGWVADPRRRIVNTYKSAITRLDDIIEEFTEKPTSPVLQVAAAQEIKILRDKASIIPLPDTSLTLEQVIEIREIVKTEIARIVALQDDDEVIALYLQQDNTTDLLLILQQLMMQILQWSQTRPGLAAILQHSKNGLE